MARFHSLKIKEVRRETSDTVSIAFDLDQGQKEAFQYIQGQYLTLKADINGEEVRRSYSICTSPAEDAPIRVVVKKVPGGKFSTFANESLKAGDVLEAMPPMGNFYTTLDAAQSKNYVAFAAGSGITPMMSIMKTIMAVEPNSTFTLFYGNKNAGSVIFKEELEDLKDKHLLRMRVYHVMSREELSSELFTGRITGDKCSRFCEHLIDVKNTDEVFLCGPVGMIEEVTETLVEAGMDKKNIHFELFTTGTPTAGKKEDLLPEENVDSKVTIILDGDEMTFPLSSRGENILDAALNSGADVPYACKGAVCSTCKARVLEGKVDMEMNYALEEDELERGFILTCQSHPVSEKVVVDFDQH